jgi:tripartite-type tricarboxylate transporter receptor subunit TctC
VARVGDLVCGFVIHPAVGPKNFAEMIAYAKANPGKLSYGSAGLGTSTQLRLEMLKYRAGIDILHVPYRGSADALNDLLPNTVQMMNEINVLPHVKAGKLILLDINYGERHPDFPDIPTLTECGYPNSDVPIWYSIFAPTRDEGQDAFDQRDRPHANAGADGKAPRRGPRAQRRDHQGGQHQARMN